ncbi:MAG: co-chaperone DjlA, partial [Enterobacterales bacterium]|nr:co-chaperone DjlA [Enterobacterales bacterium]
MQYWGKLIGLVLGLMSGTGFWGVVLGLLIGHMIDKSRQVRSSGYFSNQAQRQSLFFSTTFQVMGHLTKSKGRVTE